MLLNFCLIFDLFLEFFLVFKGLIYLNELFMVCKNCKEIISVYIDWLLDFYVRNIKTL